MRLLIIDDDQELVDSLVSSLKKRYLVDTALTLKSGEYKATVNEYDLLIVDYNLPDGEGPQLCSFLRKDGLKAPILMLTGRGETDDKVVGLDSGADDYLLKPISSIELHARVRALLRRNPMNISQNVITHDNLKIDLNTGTVRRNDTLISLRRKEFQILEYLLRNRGQIIKREKLLEHVWRENEEPNTNAIDVHIRQLRKKLNLHSKNNNAIIKSVYGFGYQIK